jgi:hypothetical protein
MQRMKQSRNILVIIALTISQLLFANDLKIHCGNRDVNCNNGNKEHFASVSDCPYIETDTNHLPKMILDNARKYLVDRVGGAFSKRLNYYSCQIVDFSKFDSIVIKKPWISKDADKRIKYAIQYYFVVQDSMRYYILIVFDKDGHIISNDELPSVKQNAQFDKILDVCEAVKVAEQDKVFSGEVETISLEFDKKENCFVWSIQKPEVRKGKHKVIERYMYLNANTGKLIRRRTETGTIVCEMESF